MRTLLICLFATLSISSFGQQNDARILLNKGQKFSVRITRSQDVDMGMGMEMKNLISSQNNFVVIGSDDKNYTISNTMTGLKMTMEVMGQQQTYDSDLKADSASEIGKSIKNLNVPDTFIVNKYTAALTPNKKLVVDTAAEPVNPMENLFESLGDNNNTNGAISEAFFIIPTGKKAGDSWIDSSSTKEQKIMTNYTIKSIEKNIAAIGLTATAITSIQTEAQGMQITVSMTTKSTGEIISDTKTSLVKNRSLKSDIVGTLELMGQSAPITGKATTESVYE